MSQTTLASMFPISHEVMRSSHMKTRTPQPFAPLPPERVRPLISGPFSLTYTGALRIADLNTELLFLARSLCSPTAVVAGGIGGFVGGSLLLVDIRFEDVTLDDVSIPLVLQGLTLAGSLSFTGAQTLFGIVHVGFGSFRGSLLFGSEVTVASLELYSCVVDVDITLPSGASLASLLVSGLYPQISLQALSNKKVYPSLVSLLYLNGIDGRAPRDIPPLAKGFGAFTLEGLQSTSYPLITTLALPDPWSVDLEKLFPNLITLYAIEFPKSGAVEIPQSPNLRYSSLTLIGAQEITSLDLSERASHLTGGIRIVGCPQLTSVILRKDPLASTPFREYRTLIVERCALLYIRGTRGMNRAPTVIRLGDNIAPPLTVVSPTLGVSTSARLLDYVLVGMPTLGFGSPIPAVSADYLPNVLVALAEIYPSLISYPVMQTVEYVFGRSTALVTIDTADPNSTTKFTQYSGGANPVVPTNGSGGSALLGAAVSASPFGVHYTLRISTPPSVMQVLSTVLNPSLGASIDTGGTDLVNTGGARGNNKNALYAAFGSASAGWSESLSKMKWVLIAVIIIALVIIGIVIIISLINRKVKNDRKREAATAEIKQDRLRATGKQSLD